jgi:nucleotide-binding universal stress UspA family protein
MAEESPKGARTTREMTNIDSGLPVRTVVIPLDGSELSARAVPAAANIARCLNAGVHFVSVASTQEEADRCRDQFDDLAGIAPGAGRETVMADERSMTAAAVAVAILEAVTDPGGIVCIASHGRGRSASVLGSVASEVTARATCPVVIVGPAFEKDTWTLEAPVVACVDGTPPSELVVPVARDWADALRASVSIVSVAEPIPEPPSGRPWRRMHGPDEDADEYMSRLLERQRDDRVAVDGTVVYDPVSVAGGLVDHLSGHPASLVSVASRARRGVPRLVLGSEAAAIVRQVTVPVLTVALPHDL